MLILRCDIDLISEFALDMHDESKVASSSNLLLF